MRARVETVCLVGVVCSTLASACGASDTAVRLTLAPDPARNSAAEILARVHAIQVVVDAIDGLAGLDGPGRTHGGGDALDWDGDGELEVIFTTTLGSRDELPVLEVGVGHNAGRDLSFRLFGFAGDVAMTPEAAMAVGATAGRCPSGELCRLGTPFNLLARARPPAVVWALPPAGVPAPANMPYVTVLLSTTVVPSSVQTHVSLIGSDDHRPQLTVTTVEVLVAESTTGTQERRSLLQLEFDFTLIDFTYTLTVGPGLIGTNGLRFDQDPREPGENPFTSTITTLGVGGPPSGCPERFVHDPATGGCVPVLDCQVWGCPPAFVCEPRGSDCVEDCRLFAGCVQPGAACAADTGLCS